MTQNPITISENLSSRLRNAGVLAVVLVVARHLPKCFAPTSPHGWFTYIVQDGIATGAVPLFFAISGFLLAGHFNASSWWKNETRKRLYSICIPYLITCVFALLEFTVIRCLFNFANHMSLTYGMLLSWDFLRWFGLDCTVFPEHVSLWYLRTLFILILLAAPLWWALKHMGAYLLLAFLLLVPIASYAIPYLPNGLNGILTYTLSPMSLFFFSLGMLVRYGVFPSVLNSSRWHMLLAIVATMVCLAMGKMAAWVAPLAYAYLIWAASPVARWPKFLTNNTFAIYLLHNLILVLLRTALISLRSGLVGCLIQWIFSIAISLAIILCLRKFCPKVAAILLGGR